MTKQPQLVLAERGAQGGHWYTRDGKLVESVLSADGKRQIRPDIRHARKLNLLPGVTSIIRVAAAPGLVKWQRQQSIMSALTLPRNEGESEAAWMERVIEDADETARKAAEQGTAIHASIARFFTDGELDDNAEHVNGVRELLRNCTGVQEEMAWDAEHVVVSQLGYATMCDLSIGGWLIDWKSKNGDEESLQRQPTYDTHHMQLAATAKAMHVSPITFPDAFCGRRCAIGFVSRTHPGACHLAEVLPPDLERGWRMFKLLHAYWCEDNDYFPAFEAA